MEISRIGYGEADEQPCCPGCTQCGYGKYSCGPTLPGLVPVEPTQPSLPGMPPAPLHVSERYRALGKEVLVDGAHYGDMIDEDAAKCAADALNGAYEQAAWVKYIVPVK